MGQAGTVNLAITGMMIVVGLINLAPLLGLVSAQRIAEGYGVEVGSVDLEILLRHRAVLFGILGIFILYAAFNAQYQPAAMVMAAVSMVAYAVLVWLSDGANPQLMKVLVADLVGIAALAVAVLLRVLQAGN